MSFWSSVSKKVSNFVYDKAQKVKDTYSDIQNETGKISKNEKYLEDLKTSSKLPWEEITNPELAESLKAKILEIHEISELFLPNFKTKDSLIFNMENFQFIAEKLITYDVYLAVLRNDLVPDLLEDEDFWHRIYYQIENIKRELGIDNKLDKILSKNQIENSNKKDSRFFEGLEVQKKDNITEYNGDNDF